jgi:predicted porin
MRMAKLISESMGTVALCCASVLTAPALSADTSVDALSALVAGSTDSEINSTFTLSAFESLTLGYLTPANRTVAFGALSGGPLSAKALNDMTGGSALADAFDIAGAYTADLHGGRVGVYGGYAGRPSTLSLEPDTAWNFGASVGYGGFYIRGEISDITAFGLLEDVEGWQAGLSYESGNLDLRLTYAASQSVLGLGAVEQQLDSKQWSIGGIYQITPRLRLNADAFYDMRDNGVPELLVAPTMATPQGTGARVGVQLRF